jgi:TIR domain
MSDIFVSYASADRDRVALLVARLEQTGFSVWWDREIAHGQNYHRVIQQALDQAKCAIVVWSEQSTNSEWVVNEASSARKRNALVPVLIDAVEPPLEFRHVQTANLRDDNPSIETEYEKLERSVRCQFPAYRSQFVFGVMAPPRFRRNGATGVVVVVGSNFQRSARLPAFCGERLWPIGGSRCINTDKSWCACARAIQTGTLPAPRPWGARRSRDCARSHVSATG